VDTLGEQVSGEQHPGAARGVHHCGIVAGTDEHRGCEPGAGQSRRAAEEAHESIFPDLVQWYIPAVVHAAL
jgi:hypothetical protein